MYRKRRGLNSFSVGDCNESSTSSLLLFLEASDREFVSEIQWQWEGEALTGWQEGLWLQFLLQDPLAESKQPAVYQRIQGQDSTAEGGD